MELNNSKFSSASGIPFRVTKSVRYQLFQAIRTRNLHRVKELLELGAPVHATDYAGHTALHLAVIYGETTECLQELIKYGACVCAANFAGDTPLHLIVENEEKIEFVTELLKHGAPVNATNCDGDSPLHLSVKNLKGLQVLLRYGADVRANNNSGDTPLHYAVATDDKVECVQLLLSHGADASALNHLKQTPLHMLSFWTDPKITERLLLQGVDGHMNDWIGRTPLGIAMIRAPLSAKLLVKYTLFRTFDGNSNNLNLSEYEDLKSYDTVARYIEECVSELTEMRKMKIKDSLTLHVFATTKNSNTALYHGNRSIQDVTEKERLLAKYPIYVDFIYPKVKCALERGKQLEKLQEVFFASNGIYQGLVNSFGDEGGLNYDCTAVLSQYLPYDDLCNFVSALANSDLSNTESSATETAFEKPKLKRHIVQAPTSSNTKKARLE